MGMGMDMIRSRGEENITRIRREKNEARGRREGGGGESGRADDDKEFKERRRILDLHSMLHGSVATSPCHW